MQNSLHIRLWEDSQWCINTIYRNKNGRKILKKKLPNWFRITIKD